MMTEDVLLPEVFAALAAAAPAWPKLPELGNKTPTVMFGAYKPVGGVEVVATTGLSTTTIEANREEQISFTVATFINVPGFDEAKTWARRSALTELVAGVFINHGKSVIPEVARAAGVRSWFISERKTSLEPAGDAIAGAGGWLGFSLLTFTTSARQC